MAENLEKSLEHMLDYVTCVQRSELFTNEEYRTILNTIRKHEGKMNGLHKSVLDFQWGMEYYLKFLIDVQDRINELNESTKNYNDLLWLIRKKITNVFYKGAHFFPNDYDFNILYFKYLQKDKSMENICVSHIKNLIQKFGHIPKVYRNIAEYYWLNDKYKSAQNYLLQGQARHPECIDLYVALIELELQQTQKPDALVKGLVKTYVKSMMEHNVSRKGLEEVYNLVVSYRDCDLQNTKFVLKQKDIEEFIFEKLVELHKDDPEMWKFLAKKGLKEKQCVITRYHLAAKCYKQGLSLMTSSKDILKRTVIGTFVNALKEEVDLSLDDKDNIKRCILDIFNYDPHEPASLDKNYFIDWLKFYDLVNVEFSEIEEIIEKAHTLHPDEEFFWIYHIKQLMKIEDFDKVKVVFKEALNSLGPRSFNFWQFYLEAAILSYSQSEVMELYKKVLQEPDLEFKTFFKDHYLQWAINNLRVDNTHDIYFNLAMEKPFNKNMHSRMYEAEMKANTGDKEIFDKIFKLWKQQFGTEDPEVYMCHMRYIKTKGKYINQPMLMVYEEAQRNLRDPKHREMISLWAKDVHK
ncbi:hypothetical protein ABEB36_000843 [Hypothenemus hampei]|uniref:U3 small nucleolar RNA-associated protein 6 N-terminal domain-containing protein n=1 Tax=Hypothenemus hampei TaxID=57062 RepID=A0ABD1FG75_HYPHA